MVPTRMSISVNDPMIHERPWDCKSCEMAMIGGNDKSVCSTCRSGDAIILKGMVSNTYTCQMATTTRMHGKSGHPWKHLTMHSCYVVQIVVCQRNEDGKLLHH